MGTAGRWYCPECGATYTKLFDGAQVCTACGHLGLRGYDNARPRLVACPVEGCEKTVWDDGGVNPGRLQHAWRHA